MLDRTKKIIIILGPPGSGKGTQAENVAESFNFFHLETSKLLEEVVRSKSRDPEIEKLREQFFSGVLLEPKFVAKVVIDKAKELARQNKSIVFSGSPRTLYEAENEMPVFEKLYKKENIFIINLNISEKESIKRNSSRRICSVCRYPIPNLPKSKFLDKCLKCGGKIIKREIDDPKIIKTRLKEYKSRTLPVIDYLKNRGYKIHKINGNQSIENVFDDIKEIVSKN